MIIICHSVDKCTIGKNLARKFQKNYTKTVSTFIFIALR